MKKLLTLAVLGIILTSGAPLETKDGAINWISIEEAEAKMKSEPRKIMVDIYTTWCGPCKQMSANTLTNKKVVEYINSNFYAVKLDAEAAKTYQFNGTEYKKQGRYNKLAYKLAKDNLAFPTFSFIGTDKQVITPVQGYFGAREYLKILTFINEEHYKTTSWDIYKKNN